MCGAPFPRPFIFSPVTKLVRKYQRKPYVTVHTRKDNHLFPSRDENAKESFNLAFELAFHSILLYPAGLLHILTRCAKRILQKFISKFSILDGQGYFRFPFDDAFSPGTLQNNWKRNQNLPSSPSSSPEESVSSASLPYLMADKNSKAINCEHGQWIVERRISNRRKAQVICALILPYLS